MRSKVALVKGQSRYGNIRQALELIAEDIDLGQRSRVLIKPNLLSVTRQLGATHRDALRAVLEFLREGYSGPIVIAEGTGVSAFEGYRNFGYVELAEKYQAELVDLNGGETVEVQVYDRQLRPLTLRFSRLVMESDYRISLCPAKTHDEVIVTLSLKNLAMGSLFYQIPQGGGSILRSLLRLAYYYAPPALKYSGPVLRLKERVVAEVSDNDRQLMHQGYAVHHLNLSLLARACPPHLSVIDAFQAMEGDGPAVGTAVDLGVAVASQDFVAADSLMAYLMGFDPAQIGYLWYASAMGLGTGSLEQMQVIGADPGECRRQFKPHPLYRRQLGWKSKEVQGLLGL